MRVVVVTGASRGIGALIAVDLARKAEHVVLAARDQAGLDRVASDVVKAGGNVTTVQCDVSSRDDRARLIAAAEALGSIDVLVNNAGIEIAVAVVDQSESDVDRQVAINLLAPIHLSRAVLPGMVSRKTGVIVMISSMSGKSPTPYNAIYTATKHGLNGFTASLRIELADTGVHAGVVCPSFVADAGMWSDTGVKAPMMLREVTPAAVLAGVNRVIGGANEVLVTPTPIRPLLALSALFPSLDGAVLRAMGVIDVLRERARVTMAGRAA